MDGKGKKNSNIIRASEIGQFHYCPISWYLQRHGLESVSLYLEYGKIRHERLGTIIKKTHKHTSISKKLIYTGIIGVGIAFFLILIEVILSVL
jgi:hypothetical protein